MNVERIFTDMRGLRRGTVAVEPAVPAAKQAFPEVSAKERIEECSLAVEAVAAVFAAATALGAVVTRPAVPALRPALPPAHYDAE